MYTQSCSHYSVHTRYCYTQSFVIVVWHCNNDHVMHSVWLGIPFPFDVFFLGADLRPFKGLTWGKLM